MLSVPYSHSFRASKGIVFQEPEDSTQVRLVQREFSRAKEYASEYEGNTPKAHFFNTRLERVGEMLGDFKAGRVLDVGCGPAMIANLFRGTAVQYYGVDVSRHMLERCAKAFANDSQFHFSHGRIEALQFPDACFDVVLCLGAFEYLLEGRAAIHEMARVAKRGGVVIVTMHNDFSPYRIWLNYGYKKLRNATKRLNRLLQPGGYGQDASAPRRPGFEVYSEKALRALFTSEGLEVEDVVYYDFNLFLSPLEAWFPNACVRASCKLESLRQSGLRRLGSGFVIRGRKSVRQVPRVESGIPRTAWPDVLAAPEPRETAAVSGLSCARITRGHSPLSHQ